MPDQNHDNEATRPVPTGGEESTRPVHLFPEAHPAAAEPDRVGEAPVAQPAVEVTLPTPVGVGSAGSGGGGEEQLPLQTAKPRRVLGRLILLGVVFVLVAGALGSYLGYQDGLTSRRNQQAGNIAQEAALQFQLGLDDIAQGRLDLAKTRLEYIIAIDPTFPGAQAKLVEVLFALEMQANPTPTLVPTPTLEPTPDTSNEDTQWEFVLKQMAGKNWDAAIQAMDNLRKINLQYKPVDVDGLYFIALRYRGIDKMLKYSDLEGGIYDLSQAEKFSSLDRDADSWRAFARLYITGAAYWEVNWEKAMEIFAQVAPFLPNLHDGSGITAVERYRIAATNFADVYIKDGAYCKASRVYQAMLLIVNNAGIEPTATWLANRCEPPTKTPAPKTPTPSPTSTLLETLTPTLELPTSPPVQPTPTPTPPPAAATPIPPTATEPAPAATQ